MYNLIFFEETKQIKFRIKYNLPTQTLKIGDLKIYIPKRIYYTHIKDKLEITIKKGKIVYNSNKNLNQLIFKLSNRNELKDLFYKNNLHKKYETKIELKPFFALDSFYNSLKSAYEKYFILDLDNLEKLEEIII